MKKIAEIRVGKTDTTEDLRLAVQELVNKVNELVRASSLSITWQGDWSAATQYSTTSMVRNGGFLWVALRDNMGVVPVAGADWALVD